MCGWRARNLLRIHTHHVWPNHSHTSSQRVRGGRQPVRQQQRLHRHGRRLHVRVRFWGLFQLHRQWPQLRGCALFGRGRGRGVGCVATIVGCARNLSHNNAFNDDQQPTTTPLHQNTTDINECSAATNPCGSNSVCTNTDGGFLCTCKQGYSSSSGRDCQGRC
jgi:hypothetical protein